MLPLGLLLLQTVAAPVPKPLGAADATITREFVRILSLVERPDGRVVVVDRGDEVVAVADFSTRTASPIGRTGSGPEEYRFPGRLSPMTGDSLLLADDGNNRLDVLGPDLKFHRVTHGRALGLPAELSPRAVDRLGRFYALVPAWMFAAQRVVPDSLPIVRFGADGKVETLTRIKAAPEPPPPARRDRPTFRIYAFAPGDGWAVTTEGRIAIVRASDYRVEWIEPDGRRTIGPPVAWRPLLVTPKDRFDLVRELLATSGVSGGKGGPGRPPGGLEALPADALTDQKVMEMVENMTFAATKAPITGTAPIIAADGTLWVERSVPQGAASVWDRFDRQGRPSAGWQLPAGRRLVGVGRGHLYLVATNEDGIERLERYPLNRRDYPGH